jgi:hypothetical protein
LRFLTSDFSVDITNKFQTTFAQGGEGSKPVSRGDCE